MRFVHCIEIVGAAHYMFSQIPNSQFQNKPELTFAFIIMWVEKIMKTCKSGLGFRETMF